MYLWPQQLYCFFLWRGGLPRPASLLVGAQGSPTSPFRCANSTWGVLTKGEVWLILSDRLLHMQSAAWWSAPSQTQVSLRQWEPASVLQVTQAVTWHDHCQLQKVTAPRLLLLLLLLLFFFWCWNLGTNPGLLRESNVQRSLPHHLKLKNKGRF